MLAEVHFMILGELLQDLNPWWRDAAVRQARGYPVRRDLQPEILARVRKTEERRAMVLLGPRQVGKTVLLLQVVDDLLEAGWPPQNLTYFDFSDDRLTEPVTAREVADVQPVGFNPEHPRVLLLDEIRSAPRWDLWLKQAVDHRLGRIVVTDSAAGLLRDGARESGLGRWDEHTIEPLSFRELVRLHAEAGESPEEVLRRVPDLPDRYLETGGFPEHAARDDDSEVRRRLRSDIAERAILRDLLGKGVDVQRVKELFVYLLQDSGAELNAEARGRDLNADPRTVREWVRLLMDTQLVVSLERQIRHAATGLRSRPKVYAADPGLVAAFALFPASEPGVKARVFEAAVFRHLREAARELEGKLSYFRHKEDLEIDFVLEAAGTTVGIEVTSGPRVRPDKLSRLRKAGEELGADRLLLIHGGLLEEKQSVALRTFLMDPVACLRF
jgi:predicted AAA+ superfamily ATPase